MNANNESCRKKAALLITWQHAAELYSKAVASLTHQRGVLPKDDYERLQNTVELGRQLSEEARAQLEAHLLEHG